MLKHARKEKYSGRHRLWIFSWAISAADDRKTLDSTVLFNAISTEATSTTTKSTKFFANLLSKLMINKGFLHKFLAGIQKKGSHLGVFGWRKPEGGNAIFKSRVLIKIWKIFFYTYLETSLVAKVSETGKK